MTTVSEVRPLAPPSSEPAEGSSGGAGVTESALELAPSRSRGGAGAGEAAATSRADRARDDAAIVEATCRKLAVLGDPRGLLQLLQSKLRDLQLEQREDSARTADSKASLQARVREEQHARAEETERRREESDDIGNVFAMIGAGLAVVAGAVSAVFTGGAALAAAIGLAIAVIGPIVCNLCVQYAGLDSTVGAVISAVCAAVGAALSFGAGAAASAPTVAAQVAQTTAQILNAASAAAQAAHGGTQIASGVYTGDTMRSIARATDADHAVDRHLGELDEAAEGVRDVVRQFGRMARKLRQITEAQDQALRAAAGARA